MKCCSSIISFLVFLSVIIFQTNIIIMKKVFVLIYMFIAYNIFGQINPDDMWFTTRLNETFYDKDGNVLTGKGVVIGDVDSGVDVFHPMFFFADGGDYNWIDVNGDGRFTPGKDAVDLNNNNEADQSEILRFIPMKDKTFGALGLNPNDMIIQTVQIIMMQIIIIAGILEQKMALLNRIRLMESYCL